MQRTITAAAAVASGGDVRGPLRRRQESPWGASLAQGPEASGKPEEPREEPAGKEGLGEECQG